MISYYYYYTILLTFPRRVSHVVHSLLAPSLRVPSALVTSVPRYAPSLGAFGPRPAARRSER